MTFLDAGNVRTNKRAPGWYNPSRGLFFEAVGLS